MPPSPPRNRIAWLATVLLIAVMLFWGMWYYVFFLEPVRLSRTEQTLRLHNWHREHDNLRIAVLSDIHLTLDPADQSLLRHAVRQVNAARPDLIVLLGDFHGDRYKLHSINASPGNIASILKRLRAPLGVFAVLGNHDWWYDGDAMRRALEVIGITVLENQWRDITHRGKSFRVIGLPDEMTRRQFLNPEIFPADGRPAILLSHSPDLFLTPGLPGELMLSGHTHGGQLRLPFYGAVFTSSKYGRRFDQGHFEEQNHQLFVTRGIGTSTIRARMLCPPEIVLLTLRRNELRSTAE